MAVSEITAKARPDKKLELAIATVVAFYNRDPFGFVAVWWKADLASATPPHGKTLEILIQSTLQRHIRKPPQVASDDEC